MQVFKVYFKIIQKNLPSILLYFFIFLGITILLSKVNANPTEKVFSATKENVAFINYDEDSKLVEGLKSYLSQRADFVDIADEPEALQDALFFHDVAYIVRIPKGFSESFMNNEAVTIEKNAVADSTSAYYLDILIDKYFNAAQLYTKNLDGITQTQLVEYLEKDLALSADVQMENSQKASSYGDANTYFNYIAYAMMAIMVLGITSIMLVFNDKDLRRRNVASPMKALSLNLQLIYGSLIYMLVAWAAMCTIGLVLYGSKILDWRFAVLVVNALIISFVTLSISFLIGNVIKSRNAQSAAANVVALGLSFISGIFVPQELLGDTVLRIASFTPTYWYVKVNEEMKAIGTFAWDTFTPVALAMLIQIGFAVAIFAVALVVAKQKRVSNN